WFDFFFECFVLRQSFFQTCLTNITLCVVSFFFHQGIQFAVRNPRKRRFRRFLAPTTNDMIHGLLLPLFAGPANSTSARQVMQFHPKSLNRVVGLADELEKQIVLRESHLQHSGFQSGEVANAGLYRAMNSLCLPAL